METLRRIYNKKVILTTFFAVMIIHGGMLFNKLCWHDDASTVFRGWTDGLHHGRWMHGIMAEIVKKVSGLEATPVIVGCIVAACIGLMACLLFDLFEIKNYYMQFPLILVFSAIPAVTGHFGYMGSAGYDFIGKMLCVISAWLLCKGIIGENGIKTFGISAFIFACSLGEYQCYVAFFLSILLTHFTQYILQEEISWKDFFAKAVYYVGAAIVGLIIYLVILQIFLRLGETELTSYAGTDTYGIVNIQVYIDRIVQAYTEFFVPEMEAQYNMFPFHWKGWYAGLMLGLLGLELLVLAFKSIRHQFASTVQCLIAFLLLPLGLNFNMIVYGAEAMHSLHNYHFIILFAYIFVLAKELVSLRPAIFKKEKLEQILNKSIYGIVAAVILLFGVLYIRYDNFCYMQIEVRQESANNYFTTLITRIQSTEGYKEEYPVVFINGFEKKNGADTVPSYFDYPITNPYDYPIVNSYNWLDYVALWCDYEPVTENAEKYLDNQIVVDMPSYPDDGSVCVLDEVVIVKF